MTVIIDLNNGTTNNFAGTVGDGCFIWGAQLEVGSTATAYQKVVTRAEITEAGVPSLGHLLFDGTDDFLSTPAINFSGTDAVTVWAAIRKQSDAARGTVIELTDSAEANNGAFHLTAPNAASATYAFESKGTALTDAVASAGVAAPNTAILTGIADISADQNILRVNGVQADSDTGDQGTGNYANAVLRIGRRGGTSLPLNGRLYGLVARGAASTTPQVQQTEQWLTAKAGALG